MFPCRVRGNSTSAPGIMLVIDSKYERDMNVAFGFSEKLIGQDEIMISDSIYNLIEPAEGNVTLEFDTS